MSLFTWKSKRLACSILAGITAAAPIARAVAEEKAAPPDFSSNNVGWVGLNGGGPFYEPVPGHVPPVSQDPAHPFVPNGVGKQQWEYKALNLHAIMHPDTNFELYGRLTCGLPSNTPYL